MNVIGYYFAYCLYPYATVHDRVSVAHIGDNMNSVWACEKWECRGWHMITESTSTRHLDLCTVNRFVGDRFCWRLPYERRLTVSDVVDDDPNGPTDVLSGHSWQLLYPHDRDDGFYAIYAWLLLPPFSQYMCISNRIMRKLEAVMVTW